MSRQGFACHSTGPIFDWIFRATFFPIQLPSPLFSLSLSAEWFSSIQFPTETARHKRVSLLFYFIIFIFIFSFAPPPPTTCSIFFYWAGIYIIRQTVGGGGSRGLPQIDFIITFYFLGDKLPAHFWTHFLCKLQRTFWPLKCPCSPCVRVRACVCVCVCAYLALHSFVVVGLCDKFFI